MTKEKTLPGGSSYHALDSLDLVIKTDTEKKVSMGDLMDAVREYTFRAPNPLSYRSAQDQMDKFKARYGDLFNGPSQEDKKAAGRILADGLSAGSGIKAEKLPSGSLHISIDENSRLFERMQQDILRLNKELTNTLRIIEEQGELIADLMAVVFEDVA